MKKILLSTLVISAVTLGTIGLSSAFFSDTETAKGNTLSSGAIDLKIDNKSYYNGVYWDNTSWESKDLDESTLFFNFPDLKPDDWGEDTISITVENNEAWACVDINLTSDDDNDCTEPELLDDPNCTENDDSFDGELGGEVNMIFWVDDGDNVLETDEYDNNVLAQGTAAEILDNASWVLADSNENNVGGEVGVGLIGEETYYIGKAWCFGQLTSNPVQQGVGEDPTVNPGILCDGENLNNATQTDTITGDISFRAEQHRNNPDFLCNDDEQELFFWIIGDEESGQLDNPVDELNFVEFGNFPSPPDIGDPYTRVINSPVDDNADEEFPWNSNYNSDYGREINIEFNYPGPGNINALLSIGWSPGRSDIEQKEVLLDNVSVGLTPLRSGTPTAGWWNDMPRFVDTFNLLISPGNHTITLRHLEGDGTLWDFIKLAEI